MRRFLVIRLSAFGDIVQSFAPFAAIRAHDEDAHITLLTTAPFAALLRTAPWFDEIRVDDRPPWWNLTGLLRLRRNMRGPGGGPFDMVFDLQTSARSCRYFALAGRPPWSGIARGCSHPHSNPRRDFLHTRERQREQLGMAGITDFPAPDLSWLAAAAKSFDLPTPFVLLVPGAAPTRPLKRWPARHYAALAAILASKGISPVILGTGAEGAIAAEITAACPAAIDLTGRTSFADIAALAARAAFSVGNDTGPMHLITAMGCPATVLFSADSDPALTAPRGPNGEWPALLRVDRLADLPVELVMDRVAATLRQAT